MTRRTTCHLQRRMWVMMAATQKPAWWLSLSQQRLNRRCAGGQAFGTKEEVDAAVNKAGACREGSGENGGSVTAGAGATSLAQPGVSGSPGLAQESPGDTAPACAQTAARQQVMGTRAAEHGRQQRESKKKELQRQQAYKRYTLSAATIGEVCSDWADVLAACAGVAQHVLAASEDVAEHAWGP